MASYYDTLVAVAHSAHPLDIAIPMEASRFISASLAKALHQRFSGRASLLDLGGSPCGISTTEEFLSCLQRSPSYEVHYGCLFVDRILLKESQRVQVATCEWFVFDWWRWMKQRVPSRQFVDALLYLCYASSDYLESPERVRLGIDDSIAVGMKQEGGYLFERIVDAVSAQVLDMWRS